VIEFILNLGLKTLYCCIFSEFDAHFSEFEKIHLLINLQHCTYFIAAHQTYEQMQCLL